jgi:uncharacterized protein
MSPQPTYLCDGCGACCRTFPIFVTEEDASREPRIAEEGCRNTSSARYALTLYPLPFHEACCFLQADQRCDIYGSRPTICRELEAGGVQCQEARRRQGFSPLLPVSTIS